MFGIPKICCHSTERSGEIFIGLLNMQKEEPLKMSLLPFTYLHYS